MADQSVQDCSWVIKKGEQIFARCPSCRNERQISGGYYRDCLSDGIIPKCVECGKKHRRVNLIGLKIRHLTVVGSGGYEVYVGKNRRYKRWLWKCRCECGSEVTASSARLLGSGKRAIKSCGCKNRTGAGVKTKTGNPADVSFRALVNKYKGTAKRRKYEWTLSDEETLRLFTSDCHYCGSEPCSAYNVYVTKTGKEIISDKEWMRRTWIKYNGIDRVDNAIGYVSSNVVSCCMPCNYAKHGMDSKAFEAWLDRLVKFRAHTIKT